MSSVLALMVINLMVFQGPEYLPFFDLSPSAAVTPGFTGAVDAHGTVDPEIIWDGTRVRMYYTAVDADGISRIALARSTDLVNWTSDGVVLAPDGDGFDADSVSDPSIIMTDDGYTMYYTGRRNGWPSIGRAVSSDGVIFGDRELVLSRSLEDGSFDILGVSEPSAAVSNGVTLLMYSGYDGSVWERIGAAFSTDGRTFSKIRSATPGGAVLGRGEHGFDDGGAFEPELWVSGSGDIRLFYSSLHYCLLGPLYRVGYTMGGPVNWEHRTPVIPLSPAAGWKDTSVKSPSIIHIGNFILMAYEGQDSDLPVGIGFSIAREYWAVPSTTLLEMSKPAGQGSITQSVSVYSAGLGNMELQSISVSGTGFSVDIEGSELPVTVPMGHGVLIPVTFNPVESGQYVGELSIGTNDPENPVISIRLTGQGG